ncbi:hypothetical protein DPX16_5261 [Anabarilius grahami]|uniref:Uncharacterized protein n=1 Tax=Anabarilius grahami TaxID=495550 RepID=A0A3N0Y1A7_ANAGA|nr:hypothetical protein DPX16_5261 [Anabarilius grahami]
MRHHVTLPRVNLAPDQDHISVHQFNKSQQVSGSSAHPSRLPQSKTLMPLLAFANETTSDPYSCSNHCEMDSQRTTPSSRQLRHPALPQTVIQPIHLSPASQTVNPSHSNPQTIQSGAQSNLYPGAHRPLRPSSIVKPLQSHSSKSFLTSSRSPLLPWLSPTQQLSALPTPHSPYNLRFFKQLSLILLYGTLNPSVSGKCSHVDFSPFYFHI